MKIDALIPDRRNARKASKRSNETVAHSLKEYGAGRSILIDREGRIIAGNTTAANAAAAGIENVLVVQTTGDQLVAVQRTDLDLEADLKAKQLAIADNRSAEFAEWNPEVLSDLSTDLDLKPFFNAVELSEIIFPDAEKANDVNAEYTGMPEYTSEDKMGARKLIVHFQNLEAVDEFARLLNQVIPAKANYIWFPREPNADLKSSKFVHDDSAPLPDLHSDAQ